MPVAPAVRASGVFVILNPKAGSYTADAVHDALERHLPCADGSCSVHEVSGQDNLTELARSAVARGCEIVVAAGGDGTVSAVADALVGTQARLGIVPLGTANVLAGELGIPLTLDAACALLAGPNETALIDTMQARGRFYLTQVGIGIDALMIRDTTVEEKRRFGRLAYLWTACTRLVGFEPRRFSLSVDGRKSRRRASQIVLANSATMGQRPFRWGPGIKPDDGRIDVCIVRARNVLDYVILAAVIVLGRQGASRHVKYLTAEKVVVVQADRPLPVQADGEIIGDTPVEVAVVPRALQVIVPPNG